MLAPTLGAVPTTARRRLVDHYGPAVGCWLDAVPGLLTEAAFRWRLKLVGYHDAGCASAIAVARTADGQALLLKAWYDRGRYAQETAALQDFKPAYVACGSQAAGLTQAADPPPPSSVMMSRLFN